MLHRPFLKRTAVLQVAENILTLCDEPTNLVRMRSPKKKKLVNLVTVTLVARALYLDDAPRDSGLEVAFSVIISFAFRYVASRTGTEGGKCPPLDHI